MTSAIPASPSQIQDLARLLLHLDHEARREALPAFIRLVERQAGALPPGPAPRAADGPPEGLARDPG